MRFKPLENNNFEEAIQKAVKEMNISEWDAVIALTWYMISHGTIDDFKDFCNYYIKNQDSWIKE